ncbi:phospholipase D/nuclease [Trametes polyzona]|nr:phospholipase D/nuclease [Trametes polyzona]
MSNSMDDDIARAIALSLQESGLAPQSAPREVIDVDADEDDEDARFQAELQRAIEASKQETSKTSTVASHQPPSTAAQASNPPPTSSTASSFLSERAKLERERLARQKRLRPDVDNAPKRPAEVLDVDEDDDDDLDQPSSAKSTPASASASVGRGANSPELFLDGELRQTANKYVNPQKDKRPVFRLSEIIGPKDDVEFAIVSAFCWSWMWVYAMFSPNTPVIAVDHDPRGNTTLKQVLPNWIRTTPFLRNGFGCMHMKFLLLFYKDGRLRVVISTANLIGYDWRDIENSVWVQDIPKRPAPVKPPANTEDFASAIVRVLHSLNVAPALANMLRTDHPNLPIQRLEDIRAHWDFSRVKAALVPSISGKHEGWPKVILSGHTRLMKALIDLGATTPKGKELALECQGSSIGNYSSTWINEFYHSARGESTQNWLDMPKTRRTKVPYPTSIKILFPTGQYVRESALGERGGGTMFCRRNQWEGTNFPRQLFHQSKSKRGPVLMHSKMILGTFVDKPNTLNNAQRATSTSSSEAERDTPVDDDNGETLAGWLYVGSHNFTPSAWGTLSGSGFNPILNVTNYELGIVIPLRTQEEVDRVACWERPPPKYIQGRDEPWIQSESPYFATVS